MTLIEFVRSQEDPSRIGRNGLLAIRPVVVDTSALVSDVYWELRTQASRVLQTAELGSVRLFAPTMVYYETYEKLPKLATGKNEGRLEEAVKLWEEKYLPLIRWCNVDWEQADDPRVPAVEDVSDRPLAALGTAIAPCHIWSDNYRHLSGVGVAPASAPSSWRSQAGASGLVSGVASAGVVGSATIIGAGVGVKEAISLLAKRPRLGIATGAVALAAVAYAGYQVAGPHGQVVRPRLARVASAFGEAVAPIIDAYRSGQELLRGSELVSGESSSPDRRVAHALAVAPRPLLMREIVEAVEYSSSMELTTTQVGRILRANAMFNRQGNGRWQLGYIAAPLREQRVGVRVGQNNAGAESAGANIAVPSPVSS